MARTALCDGHQLRFGDRRRRNGYSLERFLAELAHRARPAYVFEGLPEPLRAELQFGLHCFADRRTARLAPTPPPPPVAVVQRRARVQERPTGRC
jgi:hypothetical protein